MHLCMRTTIDLDDALALEAKKMALDRRSSLRALVEEGLRLLLHGVSPAGGPVATPLDQLRGRHRKLWAGTDADEFVRRLREDW